MDSNNHPLTSLICPAIRIKNLKSQSPIEIYGQDYFIVDNSYYFFNAKDEESSCSHHLLPIIGCNNRETVPIVQIAIGYIEKYCGACCSDTKGTTYYFCSECDIWYHKECVESSPIVKSPYHPKHSLQLYIGNNSLICRICRSTYEGLIYYCSICNVDFDPVCVTKPPFINYPKRHEHTLYYFHRKSLICDVCASDDNKSLIFVCLHCGVGVHERCIYLPNVIKIARHKHRVSLASSLLSRNWSCGVCHQKIDENYGAYSCMKNDCNYVAHSSCATRQDIWDGKNLEGEPEEVNESIEPPVEEISDGTILHFSHLEHPMRLVEDVNKWYDEKEICQACILPPYDGKVYTCMRMECGYVLHEECAYFPRVKQHPLHAHSLTLEPYGTQMIRKCHCCNTYSLGFKYVCHNTDGDDEGFSLDVRCALISEPYDYHSHMHPLFLTDSVIVCFICHLGHLRGALKCDECNFSLCFSCATLPYKVRYKNDEHLLTFLYGKAANGVYWCDLCERTINPVTTKITGFRGFYRCNECEVTLHTTCLLGVDMYMNHGSKVTVNKEEFSIVRNTTLTRPICKKCRRRCKYRVIIHIEVNLSRPLKGTIQVNEERYFVSYEGLTNICSGYGVYGHLVHVCPRRVLAEVVVSFLQTGISKAYPLSFLVRFCHGFISRDWMVRVVHMHRKANRLADGLVNYAFSLPLSFHLFQSSPASVAAIALQDSVGHAIPRLVCI